MSRRPPKVSSLLRFCPAAISSASAFTRYKILRRSAATRMGSRSDRDPSEKRTSCKLKQTTVSTDGLHPRAYKGRPKCLTNEKPNAASSHR